MSDTVVTCNYEISTAKHAYVVPRARGDSPVVLSFSIMSLAHPESHHSQTTAEEQPPVNPKRAFERVIWTNPETCNHCFAQVKHIEEVDIENGLSTRRVEHHQRTEDGVRGHDQVNGAWKPRTFCRQCGGRGCAHYDIMSKDEMQSRLSRLATRLRERNIRVSVEAMRKFVDVAKSKEKLQGKDREIFERAVKLGISRAYP